VPSWLTRQRSDVQLASLDFGGSGRQVVLLHGLAGHAGEWKDTAGWLTDEYRVLAPDARGHGRSERHPTDVSRSAYIEDVSFLVEELAQPPVILIGQSLGGQTALLLAAQRPDLVEALVLADAGPGGAGSTEAAGQAADELGRSLARWPVPFPDRNAAIAYFGGPSLTAEAWADGLVQNGQGLWPTFDVPVMIETLRQAVSRSYWEDWKSIQCPTLMVRAGDGVIDQNEMGMMADLLPQAEVVQLSGAKHDLHLDQPERWREVVLGFLSSMSI
jgi:pimeloyl-ACP methyl ester carboxylesterase